MKDDSQLSVEVKKLENDLFDRFGPVVGGKDLQKVLGYRSGDSYRQAAARNLLPVKTFKIEHRRGRFALTSDIASWLILQANKTDEEVN